MEVQRAAPALAAHGTTAAVVGFFASPSVAAEWAADVGCTLWVGADPGPAAGTAGPSYAAFGLARSLTGVWGPDSLTFYGGAVASGRRLPPSKGQDLHQMGGDFLVDNATGRVLYAHYSATNTDRPTLPALLAAAAADDADA